MTSTNLRIRVPIRIETDPNSVRSARTDPNEAADAPLRGSDGRRERDEEKHRYGRVRARVDVDQNQREDVRARASKYGFNSIGSPVRIVPELTLFSK